MLFVTDTRYFSYILRGVYVLNSARRLKSTRSSVVKEGERGSQGATTGLDSLLFRDLTKNIRLLEHEKMHRDKVRYSFMKAGVWREHGLARHGRPTSSARGHGTGDEVVQQGEVCALEECAAHPVRGVGHPVVV